jgi:hypothetical protein
MCSVGRSGGLASAECSRPSKLKALAGVLDPVEQHAPRAQVGDAHGLGRVQLAAPLDRVHQQLAERLSHARAHVLGQVAVEARQELADPLGGLALARHQQLHPVGSRRDHLDRPQLGPGREHGAHDLDELRRLDRLREVAVGVLADRPQQRLRGVVRRHHHDAGR